MGTSCGSVKRLTNAGASEATVREVWFTTRDTEWLIPFNSR